MTVTIRNRSKRFAVDFIRAAKHWNTDIALGVILRQVIRSITSIGANLTEGSAAVSKREFLNYANIARKSSIETQY